MKFKKFSEKEVFRFFNETNNPTEFCVRCGVKSINGKTLEEARSFLKKFGLSYKTNEEKYLEKPKACKKCGKKIPYKKRQNIFCDKVCSAKYNNKNRIVTEEQRRKISQTLKGRKPKKSSLEKMVLTNYLNRGVEPKPFNSSKEVANCVSCGKKIKKNKTGFCRYCLNHTPMGKRVSSETSKRLIREGKIKGWTSRNILSYPEKFWIDVLDNNNIKYVVNKYYKPYFLDFFIEKGNVKLDLEIDGKQHERKDRKESDIRRDAFLKENGFVVYRIKWNEINTEEGSKEMKDKINLFLNFFAEM